MAAAKKKRGAKAKPPPPIEGEILPESLPEKPAGKPAGKSAAADQSRKAGKAGKARKGGDGVDIFRRFVWYLTAAGVVFIAGLVAAPTIQQGIDALLGREAPTPIVVPATVTLPAESAAVESAPVEIERVPEDLPTGESARKVENFVLEKAVSPPDFAALTDRLTALEDAAANAPVNTPLNSKRLEELEARLARLEAGTGTAWQSENTAAGQRLADLEARLAQLEQAGPATGTSATSPGDGMLLALARLSGRLNAGQAYAGEMLEFRAVHDALPAADQAAREAHVAVLAKQADSGVSHIEALRRAFAEALPVALEAAALPPDAGWWDKVWAGLKGVIVVRRTGQVEGAGAEAVLARVEFHLARGDLAAALGEAQSLEADIREILAPWQADATASLAAQQALAALIETHSEMRGAPPPGSPVSPEEGG